MCEIFAHSLFLFVTFSMFSHVSEYIFILHIHLSHTDRWASSIFSLVDLGWLWHTAWGNPACPFPRILATSPSTSFIGPSPPFGFKSSATVSHTLKLVWKLPISLGPFFSITVFSELWQHPMVSHPMGQDLLFAISESPWWSSSL